MTEQCRAYDSTTHKRCKKPAVQAVDYGYRTEPLCGLHMTGPEYRYYKIVTLHAQKSPHGELGG